MIPIQRCYIVTFLSGEKRYYEHDKYMAKEVINLHFLPIQLGLAELTCFLSLKNNGVGTYIPETKKWDWNDD